MKNMRPLFRVEDVHFTLGGNRILGGVDFSMDGGEILSIIGVNGTGKTTIASLLMGLDGYTPEKGRMLFDGKDITTLSTTARAKMGITLAWQIPANFEGVSVKEYLSIGGHGSPAEYLEKVGLNPDLYLDRFVDESLSGGERKRIELASVLSTHPRLVILDEPDSGIDMASIDAIKRTILDLKWSEASVILITHSEAVARLGDRVALLCGGRIVKEGDVEDVAEFFRKHCEGCDHHGDPDGEILK